MNITYSIVIAVPYSEYWVQVHIEKNLGNIQILFRRHKLIRADFSTKSQDTLVRQIGLLLKHWSYYYYYYYYYSKIPSL
jgi:hypothetical protein